MPTLYCACCNHSRSPIGTHYAWCVVWWTCIKCGSDQAWHTSDKGHCLFLPGSQVFTTRYDSQTWADVRRLLELP